MKETLKCCLISMGIGFALGALVAANNKKVSSAMKEAKVMAMEKLEEAKEGLNKVKETISEKIEEAQVEKEENLAQVSKKKSSQSKTKASN